MLRKLRSVPSASCPPREELCIGPLLPTPAHGQSTHYWPVPKLSNFRKNRAYGRDNAPPLSCFHRGDRECPDWADDAANRSSEHRSKLAGRSNFQETHSQHWQSSSSLLNCWRDSHNIPTWNNLPC